MKNNNDSLKEKEIKSEDPLNKNELKDISGGEDDIFGFVMKMPTPSECREQCKNELKPPCIAIPGQTCSNGAIVRDASNSLYIDSYKCKGCIHCGPWVMCPIKACWKRVRV